VRSFGWWTVVALLGLALGATAAQAQRRVRRTRLVGSDPPRIGLHLGYNFDVDRALLGAQASLPLVPGFDFYPSFDYYFVPTGSLWAVNADLKYRPPTILGWYVGAGLDIAHTSAAGSSATNTNLNLLAGLEARRGPMRPYAEARLLLGNGSALQLQGGLSFVL